MDLSFDFVQLWGKNNNAQTQAHIHMNFDYTAFHTQVYIFTTLSISVQCKCICQRWFLSLNISIRLFSRRSPFFVLSFRAFAAILICALLMYQMIFLRTVSSSKVVYDENIPSVSVKCDLRLCMCVCACGGYSLPFSTIYMILINAHVLLRQSQLKLWNSSKQWAKIHCFMPNPTKKFEIPLRCECERKKIPKNIIDMTAYTVHAKCIWCDNKIQQQQIFCSENWYLFVCLCDCLLFFPLV